MSNLFSEMFVEKCFPLLFVSLLHTDSRWQSTLGVSAWDLSQQTQSRSQRSRVGLLNQLLKLLPSGQSQWETEWINEWSVWSLSSPVNLSSRCWLWTPRCTWNTPIARQASRLPLTSAVRPRRSRRVPAAAGLLSVRTPQPCAAAATPTASQTPAACLRSSRWTSEPIRHTVRMREATRPPSPYGTEDRPLERCAAPDQPTGGWREPPRWKILWSSRCKQSESLF